MGRPVTVTETIGPWKGVRDVVEPKSKDGYYLEDLRNGIIIRPQGIPAGRPGFRYLNSIAAAAQGVYFSDEVANEQHTIVVIGGVLYEFDWTALTLTNRTPGGVTIAASGRVYFQWFQKQLVVSDGVNIPWQYNVSTFAGTVLTNAPVAFGKPTVYYAKLFLIKAAERNTFVWSEEAQPNTGYEAGGYNNAWTLEQTDPGALMAMVGTNAALLYFREKTIGKILGAVTPTFKADGVHDDVAYNVGTRSPDSVIVTEHGEVMFLDHLGRLSKITTGGGEVTSVWMPARQTFATVKQTSLALAWVRYMPTEELFVCAAPLYQQSNNYNAAIFDRETSEYYGAWAMKTSVNQAFACGAVAKNLAGERVLVWLTAGGDLYCTRGETDALYASDRYKADATDYPPEWVAMTGALGNDPRVEKTWTDLAVQVRRTGANRPTITTRHLTPRATISTGHNNQLKAGPADGYGRIPRGIKNFGRWIKVQVTNEAEPIAACRVRLQEVHVAGVKTNASRRTV